MNKFLLVLLVVAVSASELDIFFEKLQGAFTLNEILQLLKTYGLPYVRDHLCTLINNETLREGCKALVNIGAGLIN